MAKLKIWREWEEINPTCWTIQIYKWHYVIKQYGDEWACLPVVVDLLKTKEQAMLKAQELIIKEYKEIEKMMKICLKD